MHQPELCQIRARIVYVHKLWQAMHLCRVMCRILPVCAVLRRAVQWFAVIVPYNAVLCRAEKATSRRVPEPSCARIVCVLGVCWRCDCVACLGSLGASAVAQHDVRGVFAGCAATHRLLKL